MELKPGYKQTQIGVVPNDWQLVRLGDIATIRDGTHQTPRYVPIGVPFYSVEHITSGDFSNTKFISEDEHRLLTRHLRIEKGDVLMTRIGSIGNCRLVDWDVNASFYVSLALLKIKGAHAAFVVQYSQTRAFKTEVEKRSLPLATPKKINLGPISDILVPLPSESEQRAIAELLSDVESQLRALDTLIAKKRDLRQAAMQHLLTGQTRLPGFSGEWAVTRLGEHLSFLRNGVNSRAELSPDGALKYLHYGDVHACKKTVISPCELPALSPDKARTLDRLCDGDLIFADASEDIVGVSKSVEISGVRNTEVVSGLHTIAVRFDKNVLADGFKGYLQYCPPFAAHLRRLAAGTKVLATNRAHIASAELSLPLVEEQTAIAAVLSNMDAELAALEARRDKTRALKQAMMQELLSRFRRPLDRLHREQPPSADAAAVEPALRAAEEQAPEAVGRLGAARCR